MTGEWLSNEFFVDHKNRNRKDNRWENLRICSAKENARNRTPWGQISSRGVRMIGTRTKKYLATIGTGPDVIKLGVFDTEEDAARAYDKAAIRMYGEFANLNMPVSTLGESHVV